jgi:hypothetical protein
MISPLSIASLCFRSTSALDGRPRFFWLLGPAGEMEVIDIGEPFEGFGRMSRAGVAVSLADFRRFVSGPGMMLTDWRLLEVLGNVGLRKDGGNWGTG